MIWYSPHVLGWLLGLSVFALIAMQTQSTPMKIPTIQRIAEVLISSIAAVGGLVGFGSIVDL